MDLGTKIIPADRLAAWREPLRRAGQKLVVTNGCFDILHAGHVTYLHAARQLGDILLVGLNSDASIRQLKGPSRPINPEQDRAMVLAALQAVDAISIFHELRATRFLERVQPDVYVKGGDFTIDQLPEDERRAVERAGGRILTVAFLPGRSTTSLLERIRERNAG